MKQFDFPVADTRPYRTEGFTTILGAELHSGRTEMDRLWHVLAVGLPQDFAIPTADETGPQIASRALEAGAFVAAAHPFWYKLTEADVLSLGNVHAIEIFNGTAYDHNAMFDSWYMLENLLERGYRYTACATDDAHFNPERGDAMLGWVHVKSETLEPDALLEALKAGHYYSSTGPRIFDVQFLAGNRIRVRCTPAARIFITGAGYMARFAAGNGLIDTEIELNTFDSPYCRVTVRDTYGRCAWSNPIWF